MSTIFVFILGFLIQATALKTALSLVGQTRAQNKFSTALGVSLLLSVALFFTGLVPFFGGLLKPLVWLLLVMLIYRIGFLKSLGVALIQALVQIALKLLLGLIGLTIATPFLLFS